MILSAFTNDQLHSKTLLLVKQERELLTTILHHLKEIYTRRLYATLGYASLFEYCTKALSYSESAAARRVSAMKLLIELPEVETKIEEGSLNLSNLSNVQRFLRNEKLNQEKKYSKSEKLDLLSKVENLSTRDCLKTLAEISLISAAPIEKQRPQGNGMVEVRMTLTEDFLKEVEEYKSYVSQELHTSEIGEVLKLALQKSLKQIRKKKTEAKPTANPEVKSTENSIHKIKVKQFTAAKKWEEKTNTDETPIPNKPSRTILIQEQKEVRRRAENQCEYVHPNSQLRCTSSFKLEFHHIKPFSFGGSSTTENLQLLCKNHHALFTEQVFGKWK